MPATSGALITDLVRMPSVLIVNRAHLKLAIGADMDLKLGHIVRRKAPEIFLRCPQFCVVAQRGTINITMGKLKLSK